MNERAEHLNGERRKMTIERGRRQPFEAELRAQTFIWNDTERYKLDGYASVVGRKYRMWDMFGEYTETIAPDAFDETLSAKPDVAFLVNHGGVSMARTTNGSLELSVDAKGLHSLAYLNPKRNDVKDLVVAIEDKDVTEMSFAFMIDDGEWNEEYTAYTINRIDIDRGDVSAVNYGANPYTSINARQSEIVRDFAKMARSAQEAAIAGAGIETYVARHVVDAGAAAANAEASADQSESHVDTTITDPHTLWIEQWLTQESLRK